MLWGERRKRSADDAIVLVEDVRQLLKDDDGSAGAGTDDGSEPPGRAHPPRTFGAVANASGTSLMTRKDTLIAFSHVIEDEALTDLAGGHAFGTFQRPEFYAFADRRWREIAAVAASAYVFADFADLKAGDDGPVRVPLDIDSPLRLEWAVVMDRPRGPMALSAVERPDQDGVPDRDRLFDSAWTTSPFSVRKAARICALAAVAAGAPEAEALVYELSLPPVDSGEDAGLAERLLDRLLTRIDRP